MPKIKNKFSIGTTLALILIALVDPACIIYLFLQGNNIALLNPKGLIAQEQMGLMIFIIGLLFIVAIPTVILLFFIAYKYRESNKKAKYAPETRHSKLLDLGMWGIPTVFMVILAFVLLPATHSLEPQKQINSDEEPLNIQVIALRWKWLFIYPEQDIATVIYLQIPVNRPVEFDLTADEAPMSAFWIPNLGGMLYAMTGHVNQLNLIAEKPGDYPGSAAEINGKGFAGMKFTARASTDDSFDLWVRGVKESPDVLDAATYKNLLKPSEYHPVVSYSSADSTLYNKVILKYAEPSHSHGQSHTKEHAH